MGRRDRQRAETRAELLAAASRLIVQDGAAALTTRAVAREADVAVGTVFAHFSDKTALLESLLHDHIEAALDEALATLPEVGLVAQLVHVATVLFAAYDEQPALSRELLQSTLFLSDSARPLAVQLRRFRSWVYERCDDAIRRGELAARRPDEAALVFGAFFSCYFGLLVSGLRGEIAATDRPAVLHAWLVRLTG